MNLQMRFWYLAFLAMAVCQELPEEPLRQKPEECTNNIIFAVIASSSVYSGVIFFMLSKIMNEVRFHLSISLFSILLFADKEESSLLQ